MKIKKQFTLIELIIVVVVIGILAGMALPKFSGVVRDSKISAMINDKETLEKTLMLYNLDNDILPLLNGDEELIVSKGISLSKMVLAEEAKSSDMETIYTSLQETLKHYNDSEENLYKIDLSKVKSNLSKKLKYGYKKEDKDFYVYSTKTTNVYYYNYLVNGKGTIQHDEYDTLLKDNELIKKIKSPTINEDNINNDDISIQNNIIALGENHSIKIGENGELYSWGDNKYGQLGIGNTTNQTRPQKVILPNEEKPISIFVGTTHSMCITDKGNLYAWGKNNYGQLGIGNTENQTTPKLVKFPEDIKIKTISLGKEHSVALDKNNNVYTWGINSNGQLGLGDVSDKYTPILLNMPNNVKIELVSCGLDFTIAKGNDGNLYAWGVNSAGQLGIGDTRNRNTPQLVTLPNKVKVNKIYTGGEFSIVITNDKNIYSWGWNSSGELGLGDKITQTTPQLVTLPNNEKPISISIGLNHSIAISEKGNLYAWGRNVEGQLGLGNILNQSTPQTIILSNAEKIMNIYAGGNYSFLVSRDYSIYVCGQNYYGQLGIGNTINQSIPIKIELP